jgi:membrane fusion protein (multidrug efflux system)
MRLFIPAFLAVLSLTACSPDKPAAPPPPTEVGVVTLKTQPVKIESELAGRTTASLSSEVRPQIAGLIRARLFEEGANVKAGQVLYRIEPAVYQAAADEARAALASAEAAVPAARLKRDRYNELLSMEGVSQQEVDDARTAYDQAVAAAAQQKATLATARINLDFTQVRAPISGRIGKSSFTVGALVTASQTDALATIRALDPMYVDLNQSSAALLRLRTMMSSGGVVASSATVRLKLEDGSDYARPGTLKFTEVAVDEATGAVTLRASFPNPDGVLLTGMYVRAVLDEATDPNGMLAPQIGITRNAKGEAVAMLVNAESKVEERIVVTGRTQGDQWIVSKGLAAGDRIIVEGLSKVRVGDTVKVVDSVAKPAAGAAAAGTPAAATPAAPTPAATAGR